jgi:predicted permease
MTAIESLIHDLKYAARMLHRNLRSTVVTVLALAIGIGINVTVFTAYKKFVLRPLDASAPKEMVNIGLVRESGAIENTFSYPDYEGYRDSIRSLRGVIAFRNANVSLSNALGLNGERKAESARASIVSENYFKVLGVSAVYGRTFESLSSSELVANPSVVISENYWQRRFSRDPATLGKTIYLNGVAVTVIGIAPRDFLGTTVMAPAFWIPISLEPLLQGDDQWLRRRENQRYRLFGRLASGVSMQQAQAEMSAIADNLRRLHDPRSESAKKVTALIWPGSPFPLPWNRTDGPTLIIQLIIVAAVMVLVVACANVGGLQLARARARQNELRTRLSLGASRMRLIRQLLTENALCGLLAGGLAFLFTSALLKVLVMFITNAVPSDGSSFVFDVNPDAGIFAYVFVISLAAGMLAGFTPAMESSRTALSSIVRAGTSSRRSRSLQDLLVAGQVAITLVLLIGGAIGIQSSIRSLSIDPGYDADHLIQLTVEFPEAAKYKDRKPELVRELHARLTGLPGVVGVTAGRVPGQGFRTVAIPSEAEAKRAPSVLQYAFIQPNYFETVGLPLISGRFFQQEDQEQSVILSESAGKLLWKDESPIGRSVRLGLLDERFRNASEQIVTGPPYRVVGIVGDARGMEFDGSDSKSVYLPLPEGQMYRYPTLIRTRPDAAQLLRAVDDVTTSLDPNLNAPSSTLKQLLLMSPPFVASLISGAVASAVGLLGLVLALMGIYGTVSYVVVLRTREVGIRMAIGAQKRNVLELILRDSARPVIAGLVVGIFLAAGASYLARGLLYGLNGVDTVAFASVSLLFLLIALLASYAPARRAMRIDPIAALREE